MELFESDLETVVLLELRLRGLASHDVVARLVERDEDLVVRQLDASAGRGHTLNRRGHHVSGWILTPLGRPRSAELLAAELHAAELHTTDSGGAGVRSLVDQLRRALDERHRDLLALCTAWQVVTADDGTERLNDHADGRHDAQVLERLGDLDRSVRPALDRLSGRLARYRRYQRRFDAALEALQDGAFGELTRPIPSSYLTVWFDLRSDVASTLGIDGGEPDRRRRVPDDRGPRTRTRTSDTDRDRGEER